MRKSVRAVSVLLMLIFVGVCAGVAASQTETSASKSQTKTDDGYDDDADGNVRGQADDAPRLGGIIVGLLCIAVLALLFAGYMRYR